jgi:D-lactate dehydrogenase
MKQGVMLINTSRGGLVKTIDVIAALTAGHISAFGADVYEAERGLFFFDHSATGLQDPVLKQLLDMPNVLITPHQAFATHEAMTNIAETSFTNIDCWANGSASPNEL